MFLGSQKLLEFTIERLTKLYLRQHLHILRERSTLLDAPWGNASESTQIAVCFKKPDFGR